MPVDEVVGHRAALRVGHEALGAEDAGDRAHRLHGLGGREGDVELEPALVDLGHEVLEPGVVRPGVEGRLRVVGENEDPDLLARAVRQRGRAADHLVARGGVDPQAERELDGLVELGLRKLVENSTASFSGNSLSGSETWRAAR